MAALSFDFCSCAVDVTVSGASGVCSVARGDDGGGVSGTTSRDGEIVFRVSSTGV